MMILRSLLILTFSLGIGLAALLGAAGFVRANRDPAPVGEPRPILRTEHIYNFAHRGASAYQAEHSIDAYRLALSQGADVLEIDVHGTRDGVLVVLHDPDLNRTTGQDRLIREIDLAKLRELAPGVLTLTGVFAAFPATPINIEIKQSEPSISAAVATAIRANRREDLVIVSSGNDQVIREFREASDGRVATGAAFGEALGFYVNCMLDVPARQPLPFDALQIPHEALAGIDLTTPEFVACAHRHGLAVHYWTVDETIEMERLLNAGADGIMTNRPDVLARVLREREQRKL